MADAEKKAEKIAAAKKKLKQFQKSGRARSASRTRDSSERELRKDQEPVEKQVRKHPPVENNGHADAANVTGPEVTASPGLPEVSSTTDPVAVDTLSETKENQDERATASTESLHQISRQINSLLLESSSFMSGEETTHNGVQELEERNRDLAAHLEKHAQANEQLNIQNHQLREHSKALQDQLEAERHLFHEKQKKDIGSLKEQLQVHIQTIGILVAEKTELQSQVGQSQRVSDQRLEEIEELNGRLKASRQRVSDLERSLSTSSQSSQNLQQSAAEYSKEIERLNGELQNTRKHKEELQQQSSELREQLQSKTDENRNLASSVSDLEKRVEMAELYAQQLSNESDNSHSNIELLNNLQRERDSLLERLQQHEAVTQKLQSERDQVTEQYQQYTDQLRHQGQQLTQQITVLTEEREQLLNRQHDLEGSVVDLQKKLEDASNISTPPPQPSVIPPEITHELETLRSGMAQATEALESQVRDNMQLSRLLEEKEDRISVLERSVEEHGQREGDQAQLLESVQSDRTALSRALTQNKELKSQLTELQAGFVKISNENMELVTRLQTEEHTMGEMQTRLAQQHEQLEQFNSVLSQKDSELEQLKAATAQSEKESYQQDQIKDRLRHYEAQAQLVDTLQNELTSAQDMMEALTTQNSELRTMLIKATEVKPVNQTNGSGEGHEDEANPRDEIISSLQDTIKQLEGERTQMYENLKEQRQLSDRLGIQIADLNEELIRKTVASQPLEDGQPETYSRSEYNELRHMMELIQQKYMHVMQDKAELSDKADQLEHLVLQLQGETDTIGEYISLYHHQRALLQQRETQKNDYISQLARDREQLQDKLGELQALVMQLLGERNMLHSYTEESRASPSPHSSPAPVGRHHNHSNHHNKMTNGYENDWPDYTSSESDTDSEVEPIVGGQGHTTPDGQFSPPDSPREGAMPGDRLDLQNGFSHATNGEEDSDNHNHSHHHHHHEHADHHSHHGHHHHQHEANSRGEEKDGTAHKILSLLTELGHSHLVESVPLIDRNFLPCKFCKGAVQIV